MQKKVNDPNTTPIKQDVVKYKIRASIDNFYDTQKLRIQCGNRICAAIRQTDDETENDNILKTLASEYNRVTDVLATLIHLLPDLSCPVQSVVYLSLQS